MSIHAQGIAILFLAVGIYVLGLFWALWSRQLLRSSAIMALAAIIPLIWQVVFTDSEAKGEGLIAALLLPIPILIVSGTLVFRGIRLVRMPKPPTP
jgi:hypothetical protein